MLTTQSEILTLLNLLYVIYCMSGFYTIQVSDIRDYAYMDVTFKGKVWNH